MDTYSVEQAIPGMEIGLTEANLQALFYMTNNYNYAVEGIQSEHSPSIMVTQSRWLHVHIDPSLCAYGITIFVDTIDTTLVDML